MDIRVKSYLYDERDLLQSLLDSLDEQYSLLLAQDKDIVAICTIADKIDTIAKSIALNEIERRKIISNDHLISQLKETDDSDLIAVVEDISRIKKLVDNQNDINRSFVKQNLFFTKKMLKIITPNEKFDTYSKFGKKGI